MSAGPNGTESRVALVVTMVSHKAKVWIALWTVYIVWGSTYLGIELAGETMPPFFGAGMRFLIAGLGGGTGIAAMGKSSEFFSVTDFSPEAGA